jgi:hypothetical protein
MAAVSPICEFGILAARARSKENAAIAKSSVPPRGGKTGHSCKAQQDKSVELTDCGQSGLVQLQLLLTQHFPAFAVGRILQRSGFHRTGRSMGSEHIFTEWLSVMLTRTAPLALRPTKPFPKVVRQCVQ